jgi:hypothetical protein
MSGQANMLGDLVNQFKIKNSKRLSSNSSSDTVPSSRGAKRMIAMPEKTSYTPVDGAADYGKY